MRLVWIIAFLACPPVTLLVYLLQRRQQQVQPPQQITSTEFLDRANNISETVHGTANNDR
jgi:hypothetical protein